jgi:hypothetical protein
VLPVTIAEAAGQIFVAILARRFLREKVGLHTRKLDSYASRGPKCRQDQTIVKPLKGQELDSLQYSYVCNSFYNAYMLSDERLRALCSLTVSTYTVGSTLSLAYTYGTRRLIRYGKCVVGVDMR